MTEVLVRRAEPEDAPVLARLANELDLDQGGSGKVYEAETILRDCFGVTKAVDFLLAEHAGKAIGYAMYCNFYNSDQGVKALFLNDLYIAPAAQGRGVGRLLMAAIAAEAKIRSAQSLWWGVYTHNTAARVFYERLGARDEDARILELDGAALDDLAATAPILG